MKTETVRLIWTGASRQTYGTRRMVAGGEFEAARADADVLIRIGQAKLAPEPNTQPRATAPEPVADVDSSSPPPVSHETPPHEDEPVDDDASARRPRGRPPRRREP